MVIPCCKCWLMCAKVKFGRRASTLRRIIVACALSPPESLREDVHNAVKEEAFVQRTPTFAVDDGILSKAAVRCTCVRAWMRSACSLTCCKEMTYRR